MADAFYRHIVLTYFIATLRPGEMLSGDLFLSVDLGFVSESICEEEDKTPKSLVVDGSIWCQEIPDNAQQGYS